MIILVPVALIVNVGLLLGCIYVVNLGLGYDACTALAKGYDDCGQENLEILGPENLSILLSGCIGVSSIASIYFTLNYFFRNRETY